MKNLKITTKEFYAELKKQGVLTVPGEYFFFGNHLEGGLPPLENHPHYSKCLRINYAGPEDEVDEGIRLIAETYKKFSR